MSFDIEAYIRPHIRAMPAYEPILPYDVLSTELGIPIDQLVKLDANENPYGPLPEVGQALAKLSTLHIYPDPESRRIRGMMANYHGIPEQNIVMGAGADELIDLIMRMIIDPGDGLINCPPTFGMYAFDGDLNQASIIRIPRKVDFSLDISKIQETVKKQAPKLIFLANPNNPNGGLIPKDQLEAILSLPIIVVLDEAYINFSSANSSWINEVENFQNLIVLRTFSKWAGLAGARLGYGVFPSAFVDMLMKAKQPYNVSVSAEEAACVTMQNIDKVEERTALIINERQRLFDLLTEISWLEPYPSQANFILCKVLDKNALDVKIQLRKRGILIRHFNKPGLQDHIRISVGKPEETKQIIDALADM